MYRSHRWSGVLIPLVAVLAAACGEDNPVDPGLTPPAAPVGLMVEASGTDLVVSWTAVTGADSYIVQRQEAASGAGFTTLASNVAGTSYTDDTVVEGVGYNYRVFAVNAGGQSNPSDPVFGEVGLRVATLSGTITSARTLSADTVYTIEGLLIVDAGGSLTVPAGTRVLGSTTVQPSALIVRAGGQLFSNGTADAPVVFTSDKPAGQRARGDWGGIVLNGRSLCNFPAGECVGEGNSGPYGGNVLDDDSGAIVYTRIEFAGFEVSFGNELNALTMNGVGSGTEIHHVQAHYGSDDGFEWFGGTVNAKYLLATGISDDSFDYSTGWQGKGQFWIAQQDPNDADNGFEVDGNEDNFDATPFTQPLLYNITLVGKGPGGAGGAAGESTRGMLLRRGTAGDIFNAIIVGFGTSGLDIDNAETVSRITSGDFSIQNSIVFSNAVNFDTDGDGIDEQAIFETAGWNNRSVDPGLTTPYDRTNPDFRPVAGSAATTGAAAAPGGTPSSPRWTSWALSAPAPPSGTRAGPPSSRADASRDRGGRRRLARYRPPRPRPCHPFPSSMRTLAFLTAAGLSLGVLAAGACSDDGSAVDDGLADAPVEEGAVPSPEVDGERFPGSAASLGELGTKSLEAFVAGDSATLAGFRLTEEEHNGVVFPELPAGRPEVNYPVDLAWQNIELRNGRSLARQMAWFADRLLVVHRTVCQGGTQAFRTFVVHTDCWIYFEDSEEGELRIQLFKDVVERGGGFKVFRYYDDPPQRLAG